MAIYLASNNTVVSTTNDFILLQQRLHNQRWQGVLHLTLQSLWQETNPGNLASAQPTFKKISIWLEQNFTLKQAYELLNTQEQSVLHHQLPQKYFKTILNLSKGNADPNSLLQLTKELALANLPQTTLILCHLLLNESFLTIPTSMRSEVRAINNHLTGQGNFSSLDLFYQTKNVLNISQDPFTLAQWVVAGSFFQFSKQIGIQLGLGKSPITQLLSRWAGIAIGTNLEAASLSLLQMTPQLWQGGVITFSQYQNHFWHNLITLGCIKMGIYLGNETFKVIHQADNYLHITRGVEWATVSKPTLHYLGSALALTSAQQLIQPQRSWIDHWLSSQTDLAAFFFAGKILQQVLPITNHLPPKISWNQQFWNPPTYLENLSKKMGNLLPIENANWATAGSIGNKTFSPFPSIVFSQVTEPIKGQGEIPRSLQSWKKSFLQTMLPSEIKYLFNELLKIHGVKTKAIQQLLLQLAQIHPDPQIRPLFIKYLRKLQHQTIASFRERSEEQLDSLKVRLRNKPQQITAAELTHLLAIYAQQKPQPRTQIAFILFRALSVANPQAAKAARDGLLQLVERNVDLTFLEQNILHWINHDFELHLHPVLKDFIIQYVHKYPERFIAFIDPTDPNHAEKIVNFIALSQYIAKEWTETGALTFEEVFSAEPFSSTQLKNMIPSLITKISQGVDFNKNLPTPEWIKQGIWLLRDLMESRNSDMLPLDQWCIRIVHLATKTPELQVHHVIAGMVQEIKFELHAAARDALTKIAFKLAYDYLRPQTPLKDLYPKKAPQDANATTPADYATIWLALYLELGNKSTLSKKVPDLITMLRSPKVSDIIRIQIIKMFHAMYPKNLSTQAVQELIAVLNQDPNILNQDVANATLDIILSIQHYHQQTVYADAVFAFVNRCRLHPKSPDLRKKANDVWKKISGQEHRVPKIYQPSQHEPLH